MKLISFSLFGSAEKYNRGAVENAKLAAQIYPDGWTCRFYCDDRVTVTRELLDLGCEVILMPRARANAEAMCWRFLPAAEASIERVIVRDADSRLNVREAAAVAEWIKSGQPFHVMRDHEHHRCFAVFGGLWGCVGGVLPEMAAWIRDWPEWHDRLDDMLLLQAHAWPVMHNRVCHHASVPNPWGGEPFPPHGEFVGHVGQVFEE